MLRNLAVLLGVTSGVVSRSVPKKRLDNGVGRTPALGWNSWAYMNHPSRDKTLR